MLILAHDKLTVTSPSVSRRSDFNILVAFCTLRFWRYFCDSLHVSLDLPLLHSRLHCPIHSSRCHPVHKVIVAAVRRLTQPSVFSFVLRRLVLILVTSLNFTMSVPISPCKILVLVLFGRRARLRPVCLAILRWRAVPVIWPTRGFAERWSPFYYRPQSCLGLLWCSILVAMTSAGGRPVPHHGCLGCVPSRVARRLLEFGTRHVAVCQVCRQSR